MESEAEQKDLDNPNMFTLICARFISQSLLERGIYTMQTWSGTIFH